MWKEIMTVSPRITHSYYSVQNVNFQYTTRCNNKLEENLVITWFLSVNRPLDDDFPFDFFFNLESVRNELWKR